MSTTFKIAPMTMDAAQARDFLTAVRKNPFTAALIERLPALRLPDCWLVAGCLFQTIWNARDGNEPTAHIRDYDVFYFDECDLSYDAEDMVIRRVSAAFADLPIRIEVKNQARVHLWYQQKFGHAYPRLQSSTDGIDRFLVECTCVAVRCAADEDRDVYASYGLADMYAGLLRPNRRNRNAHLFAEKAAKYQERWPWLRIGRG